MGNNENEERTIRLRLTNYREYDLDFFLEPEGMGLFIPPKTTIEIEIKQKEDVIDIAFEGPKDDLFFSVDYYSPNVFQDGKLIHPLSTDAIFNEFKQLGEKIFSEHGKFFAEKDIKLSHDNRRILSDYMVVLRNLGLEKFKEKAAEVNLTDEEMAILNTLVERKAYLLNPPENNNL